MNKRMFALPLSLCVLLGGCSLALPEDAAHSGEDLIVGALITEEHLDLFDFEGYLNDHMSQFTSGGDFEINSTAGYDGRIYAQYDEEGNVFFEGIDGIAFLEPWEETNGERFWKNLSDEAVSDVRLNVNITDEEEHNEIEGTINLLASTTDEVIVYTNPIYQTPTGEIYLCSGSGFSTNSDAEGSVFSTSLKSSIETETAEGRKVQSGTVKVNFSVMYEPVRTRLIIMNAENEIIRTAEYAPGEMPEEIAALPETAYFIVENVKKAPDGRRIVSRSLIEPDTSGDFPPILSYSVGEKGMIRAHSAEVVR